MKKKYEKPILTTEEILEKVALACSKTASSVPGPRCKSGISAS